MYRAVTLLVNRAGIQLADRRAVLRILEQTDIKVYWADSEMRVTVNGEDVMPLLRRPEIDHAVRFVASLDETRQRLLPLQRELARDGGVVMEGRDIGSVVLPNADLKIYLDASIEVRAQRRFLEHRNKGENLTEEQVVEEVHERDKLDRERKNAPLVRGNDAILVDNTGIGIDETVRLIVMLAQERQNDIKKAAVAANDSL